MRRRNFAIGFLILALLSLAVLGAALMRSDMLPLNRARQEPVAPARPFAEIYRERAAAVVSIYSSRTIAPPRLLVPLFPFFGFPEYEPSVEARSSGSGFFVSADGYVLTNDHVVAGAERVQVVLQDKRRLYARLIGRDPGSDLALLKVDGGAFPFVQFDQSARPRVGDWVMAIGNPFGLGSTATAGIVSAYGRNIGVNGAEYMQLDAPLNPGSSGGPAFDVRGRVIGVNTAILSPDGGFIGIGFALPAHHAQAAVKRLMKDDRWGSRADNGALHKPGNLLPF